VQNQNASDKTTEHVLKTLAPYWDAIKRGDKAFEVRRDDRGFQRGDVLVLRRMSKSSLGAWREDFEFDEYRDLRRRVSYILTGGQFGIEPGYVVMGLQDV